jgi:Zn-dependent peptidase ImmA (M78 family)
MRWADAHKQAMLMARRAHKAFDVDVAERIDVFGVIEEADLLLGFEPLPRMSGAYFAADKAILINSNHPLARQRYTAGHELGHFIFGHETSIDPQTDPLARWGGRGRWPDHEKQAEAFAAWFLMPRPLVATSLKQLGISQPESPEDVYALALRLGTSYQATLRHLPNLKLISDHQMRQWVKQPLSRVKLGLAEGAPPENLRNDVWHLTERDAGTVIAVRAGDRLVVALADIPSTGYVWQPERSEALNVVGDSFDSPARVLDTANGDAQEEGQGSRHVFVLDVADATSATHEELRLIRTRPWIGDVAATYEIGIEILAPRIGISEEQMRLVA